MRRDPAVDRYFESMPGAQALFRAGGGFAPPRTPQQGRCPCTPPEGSALWTPAKGGDPPWNPRKGRGIR